MKRDMIIHTSIDDVRSSLQLLDPITCQINGSIKEIISWLNKNVVEEMKGKNRRSMINILQSKIKQLQRFDK